MGRLVPLNIMPSFRSRQEVRKAIVEPFEYVSGIVVEYVQLSRLGFVVVSSSLVPDVRNYRSVPEA